MARTPLAHLGDKTMLPTRGGRPQCWAAETEDGILGFAREEDAATSWTVTHLPTKTVVETFLGSLLDCRAYVGSGEAQADLERLLAEKAKAA